MKRCSQCDFVYEDDQSLCDMDGAELVYEPTLYPLPASAATTSSDPLVKTHWRSFALTAGATIILGAFLSIGFYGFTNRTEQQASSATTTASPESAPQPVIAPPDMAATPSHSESPASPAANVKARSGAAQAVKPSPVPFRSPAPKEVKKPLPAKANQEKESKVGSLLKKTGRILKKPFKF
jgi:hypothetical protein